MRRSCRFHVLRVAVVALGLLFSAACVGSGLKFNEQRLQDKCGVNGRDGVTLDQARCMAKVAGLKDGRRCPLEVNEIARGDETVVFEAREGCSTLGLEIDKATGEVVAVEIGEGKAP
jgi:hypothetical protein